MAGQATRKLVLNQPVFFYYPQLKFIKEELERREKFVYYVKGRPTKLIIKSNVPLHQLTPPVTAYVDIIETPSKHVIVFVRATKKANPQRSLVIARIAEYEWMELLVPQQPNLIKKLTACSTACHVKEYTLIFYDSIEVYEVKRYRYHSVLFTKARRVKITPEGQKPLTEWQDIAFVPDVLNPAL